VKSAAVLGVDIGGSSVATHVDVHEQRYNGTCVAAPASPVPPGRRTHPPPGSLRPPPRQHRPHRGLRKWHKGPPPLALRRLLRLQNASGACPAAARRQLAPLHQRRGCWACRPCRLTGSGCGSCVALAPRCLQAARRWTGCAARWLSALARAWQQQGRLRPSRFSHRKPSACLRLAQTVRQVLVERDEPTLSEAPHSTGDNHQFDCCPTVAGSEQRQHGQS
jgi:hypothetical protein